MAMRVLCELIVPIQAAFIMVDETTDAVQPTKNKLLSVLDGWMTYLRPTRYSCEVESTEASAILFVIYVRDVLKRFNISIANLRGHAVL